MTDQEHAKAISRAAGTLNAAIRAAHADGLRVVVTVAVSRVVG